MMNCGICGNATIDFMTLYDDRYGYPGLFQLTRCPSCGHKSLNADFTPEMITRLYTDYYPRSSFDLDKFQPHKEVSGFGAWLRGDHSFAFRWVPKNVRILDIGCGFGETLGYHKARGCDVYGVEADENIRRVAEKFGYNVHVGLFDPMIYEPAYFDYITMDQVVEHIINPLDTLRGIERVLKPNGKIIIGTPNSNGWGAKILGTRWVHWHTPYHLHFFSKESMTLVAKDSGLILERVKTITDSNWLHFQWLHLLTRPPMGVPSSYWAANIKKNMTHQGLITLMSWYHYTKINQLSTRLFDKLGIGDNYLFFLRKI